MIVAKRQKDGQYMDLKKISRQMRLIADSIDELLGMGIEPKINYHESKEVADEIRKTFKKSKKPYKYKPGTHWTQKPENRERLNKMVRKAAKKRARNG